MGGGGVLMRVEEGEICAGGPGKTTEGGGREVGVA